MPRINRTHTQVFEDFLGCMEYGCGVTFHAGCEPAVPAAA
jgi:hypothetical protein